MLGVCYMPEEQEGRATNQPLHDKTANDANRQNWSGVAGTYPITRSKHLQQPKPGRPLRCRRGGDIYGGDQGRHAAKGYDRVR
jgi:hypothetical protein